MPLPKITIFRDEYPTYPGGVQEGGLIGFSDGGIRFYINKSGKSLKKWILEDRFGPWINKNKLHFTWLGLNQAYLIRLSATERAPDEYQYAFVQKDNLIYEIAVGGHINFLPNTEPYMNKIVRSFRFISEHQPSNSINSSLWRTYHDSELGLSFRYPASWKVNSVGVKNLKEIAIFNPNDPMITERVYLTETYTSIDAYQKSYQGSLPSILTVPTSFQFLGKPAKMVPLKIGTRQVGQYIFTSDQVFQPFSVLFEPNDPTQKAIVDSFTVADTESSQPVTDFKEIYLYIAQKDGKNVVLKKVNIMDGSQQTLFTYRESADASSESGNLWEGLAPSVSLSHDHRRIVYTSDDGIFVRDLITDETTSLVTKTANPPSNTDEAPSWSNSELSGVHILATPQWSSDDTLISFGCGYSEGATTRIIYVQTKKIISLHLLDQSPFFGVSWNLAWSPSEAQYVIPNSGGYQGPGLWVGNTKNLGQPIDFSKYIASGADYNQAEFSPDGKKVVTVYGTPNENEKVISNISLFNISKKTSKSLVNSDTISKAFWGNDNSHVYFLSLNQKNVLSQYNLFSNKVEREIDLPEDYTQFRKVGISSEGYIILWAMVQVGHSLGSDTNRLYIIDPNNGQIIYTSKLYKGLTNFLGLATK